MKPETGNRKSNILVIGAGAIGCLVGGRLSLAGNSVTLLGREKLARAVARSGLRLQMYDGRTQTTQPRVITNLSQITDFSTIEIVLVTVKSFDTAAAMTPLTGKLAPPTRIVSLQNGVGNEELLMEMFPAVPVVAGSITFPVTMPEPGLVAITKKSGAIGLAAASPNADPLPVLNVLRAAGFTVKLFADYRSLKWSKLLMNIISNAIPAILDMPPAESLADDRIFALEMESIAEALAVMRAAGIAPVDVPGYPVRRLARAVRWLPAPLLKVILKPKMVGGRGQKLPSLMLDMRRGRNQSEVNVLNRMIAETGAQFGVPTPVNTTISSLLNGILDGSVRKEVYRHSPAALWTAVNNARNEGSVGG